MCLHTYLCIRVRIHYVFVGEQVCVHFNCLIQFILMHSVVPVILIPLANTTQSRENTHVFVCAAVADPQPVFVFRFNGERIMSNSSKHTMVTNSTHGTLTVFDLQGSDEGIYNCSISNRFGSVSTAAVLSVQGVFDSLHLNP